MRGADALIALRRRGMAPALVHIETVADHHAWCDRWQHAGIVPQLLVSPDETPERLDLRCLVGLTVEVHGEDCERIDRVVAACQAAGAKRVIAVEFTPFNTAGEVRVVRVSDTAGAMTWPN